MRAVISRVGVGLGALACGLANPGGAQAAPPEKLSLEEVVVTATRREDNLLNVPVSVTAVTAASLEMSGAKNLEDVARSVPGLAIQQSDEQSDKIFVIRGIGGGSTAGGGVQSSTVAVYLDDTPITFGSSSPDLQLFDVSHADDGCGYTRSLQDPGQGHRGNGRMVFARDFFQFVDDGQLVFLQGRFGPRFLHTAVLYDAVVGARILPRK